MFYAMKFRHPLIREETIFLWFNPVDECFEFIDNDANAIPVTNGIISDISKQTMFAKMIRALTDDAIRIIEAFPDTDDTIIFLYLNDEHKEIKGLKVVDDEFDDEFEEYSINPLSEIPRLDIAFSYYNQMLTVSKHMATGENIEQEINSRILSSEVQDFILHIEPTDISIVPQEYNRVVSEFIPMPTLIIVVESP